MSTTSFYVFAAAIGIGIHFGVLGLIVTFIVMAPIALVIDWWRKKKEDDWP
jgi:predicted PurR-regulated permease PerM